MKTINRSSLSDYTTVDLTLTAKNIWAGAVLSASIHNLFDKKYVDPDITGSVMSDFPRADRSFILAINYDY
ncbi:unnamed protein product [marine sediment metagenome]|uniref:Uncharacterized protein n=1 Tax=marine sediment metagenome TaxID=412755 RepID=X1HBA7_9ZZZZ